MNRIVREHYPVARLPEDLRQGLEQRGEATVTVELDPPSMPPGRDIGRTTLDVVSRSSWVARGKQVRRTNFASGEEVDEYLRHLRD